MGVEGQSRRPPGRYYLLFLQEQIKDIIIIIHISPPRPHGPMGACTHRSTNVQVARARIGPAQRSTRTPHARGGQDATPAPLLARIRACERWRGERYRQTPGDHATNLGATMLVLLNGSAGLSSAEELGTQWT